MNVDPEGVPAPSGRSLLVGEVDTGVPWWTCHPLSSVAPEAPCFHASPGAGRFSPVLGPGGARVPVLYAADEAMGAVAEVMLRSVSGGDRITPPMYERRGLSRLAIQRRPRVLVLHSAGLIRAGVGADRLTAMPGSEAVYRRTARWAQHAYDMTTDDGPLDGLVWMSRLWNTAQAILLFGDRIGSDVSFGERPERDFSRPEDQDWLTRQCAVAGVEVAVVPGAAADDL